jgi:two-component system cell cycle sensor histidine kinase/response regulator CckA
MLSVSDTGSGMSKEVQSHLFEPFFTTKPVGRGTGLGLATVYGIVKQSAGHVCVQSAPGAGTTFRIYFPIVPESSDSRPAEEKSKAVSLTASTGTVLVVEDNAPLRRLSERILRQHGYTILVATNGAQAQQICAEHDGPIHVVLMDVIMPGESGPRVWEQICENRPETKIIYMSGYTADTLDQRPVFGSGNGFLQKPFNAAQLAGAVLEALQPRRNARVPPSGS